MPIVTELDKVRLEIGDTRSEYPLFYDDEIEVKIAEHPNNYLLAAADLCDILSTRFARDLDFTTDGTQIRKSHRSEAYAKRAAVLRLRALQLTTIGQVKEDGYGQGVDNTQTQDMRNWPPDPDIPRYGPSWSDDLARINPNDYVPPRSG